MNILHSGGAKGADATFGKYAALAGHQVRHYSFYGHKHDKSCPPETIIQLNEDQLHHGESALTNAGKILGRPFPTRKHYVDSMLRRNYWQIKDSEKTYAVGYIDFEKGLPFGGTAWAVLTGIQRFITETYFYDQNDNMWYKFNAYVPKSGSIHWDVLEGIPPRPEGEYAGIGSRELTDKGAKAIERLYE